MPFVPGARMGFGAMRPMPVRTASETTPAANIIKMPQRSPAMGRQASMPSFKKGGKVKKTGVYKLHKGERVISAARALGSGKKRKPWKSKKGQSKIAKTMHEWGQGKLRSGSKHGPVVKSQKQAVAIALSQARKEA